MAVDAAQRSAGVLAASTFNITIIHRAHNVPVIDKSSQASFHASGNLQSTNSANTTSSAEFHHNG